MPVLPTYPGVYIEEIPSGVRPIVGVATSITAFLGRTLRGPVNTPVAVTSLADFQNQFGGLDASLPLTFAVRDFYLNGGSQAVVVRLYQTSPAVAAPAIAAPAAAPAPPAGGRGATPAASQPAPAPSSQPTPAPSGQPTPAPSGQPAPASGDASDAANPPATNLAVPAAPAALASTQLANGLLLQSASPGNWGKQLAYAVDYDGIQADFAARYGLQAADLFNMTVTDAGTGATERFVNLTVASSPDTPRRVDRVLAQTPSRLVRVVPADGTTWPAGLARPATAALDSRGRPQLTALTGGADSPALQPATYTAAFDSALDTVDLFNLLCIPPDQPGGDTDQSVYQAALEYCYQRRAMLLVDPPAAWGPSRSTADWLQRLINLGLSGDTARNAALYYPRVIEADPSREGQLDTYVPCGIVAGIMASTDLTRGVWKAPAGVDASVSGIVGLSASLNDADSAVLNPLGINALRTLPVYGTVVWGARTLRGADLLADDYKYIPVRRLALYIEESLYRGLKWAVFEPNDEPLWSQIRLNVGAFMNGLFRQGAFQGGTPSLAYFVKCDKDTTRQTDIDQGVVNVVVGFAPLRPAEFVIVQLQQMVGQIAI
jgi:Bacteriophage tail sheath protein